MSEIAKINHSEDSKGKKLVMFWGDTISEVFSGDGVKISSKAKNAGYLVAQYYPEEISVSRAAEYDSFTPGMGVGDVQSWTGTGGIEIDSLSLSFSRDRESDKFLWQNNYEYDVELIISLMHSLLVPRYDDGGGIIDLPPQVWFDWGYDIFGYGDVSRGQNNSNFISRFYITSVSHQIDGLFPDTNKIRAVTFDITLQETVFYDGKIDSSRFSRAYRKAIKSRKERKSKTSSVSKTFSDDIKRKVDFTIEVGGD